MAEDYRDNAAVAQICSDAHGRRLAPGQGQGPVVETLACRWLLCSYKVPSYAGLGAPCCPADDDARSFGKQNGRQKKPRCQLV